MLKGKIEKKIPPIGKLHQVNGSNMHIQCEGNGSSTVIFESGLGSDLSSWEDVFYAISQFTRTCRYDRKGYGHSEYGSHEKSLDQQAKKLLELRFFFNTLLNRWVIGLTLILAWFAVRSFFSNKF